MVTEATSKIDNVIRDWISPLLKAEGFRKKGQRFWKIFDDHVWVIEIQRGRYNEGSNGEFTINLGVYFPEWVRALSEIPRFNHWLPVKELPAESDCFIRERLDCLVHMNPDGSYLGDKWWVVSDQTTVKDLGENIASAISTKGIEWLKELSFLEPVLCSRKKYYSMKNTWFEIVTNLCGYVHIGDLENAQVAYKAALENCVNPKEAKRDLESWAKSKGIARRLG